MSWKKTKHRVPCDKCSEEAEKGEREWDDQGLANPEEAEFRVNNRGGVIMIYECDNGHQFEKGPYLRKAADHKDHDFEHRHPGARRYHDVNKNHRKEKAQHQIPPDL